MLYDDVIVNVFLATYFQLYNNFPFNMSDFRFIHPDKSSIHMQSKTVLFYYIDTSKIHTKLHSVLELRICHTPLVKVIHLYSPLYMRILNCALHFSMGDFSRLLVNANSTDPRGLQSLKVQVTNAPFLDDVIVKYCRH